MGEQRLVTDSALEFGDALPEGGALLGLDIGTKTVGIAICDAGWRFATAGQTLQRGKFAKDCGVLRDLAKARSIAGLVVGLPRNMDGTQGPRAQASRAYAKNLSTALDLPALLWDERWSTASAEAAMIGQDMSRAKRAARIDSHAAAVILQGALDALTN